MAQHPGIYLGNDEIIKWIDFDPVNCERFEVNLADTELETFFKEMELVCSAECCGIDAFDFGKESITNASKGHKDKLRDSLIQLKQNITPFSEEVVSISVFNNALHKQVAIKLIDHITGCLLNSKSRS